jgi:protein transport protein SEC24
MQYAPVQNEMMGYPHQVPPPPHQERRGGINPRVIPSATTEIGADISKYKEQNVYRSTAPATLPPLVTTLESRELEMSLEDGGCVRPCHMRSTIYQVPTSKDLLESSGLEFAIVVKPFDEAEAEYPFVPLSTSEIKRCNRCKAYVNPFSLNGQCCICNFKFLGIQDAEQRPELTYGSYEFRVPLEYYRNQIAETRRPHIIFAIEVTANSKHLVQFISKHLAEVIKNHFPRDFLYSTPLSPLVGFVTYNSKITIYDVMNGGHAYIVSDVSSVTDCASTSKFLVDPNQNFEAIEKFLALLPELCQEQLELEQQTVLGPVVEAALKTCLYDTSSYFDPKKPNPKVIPTGKMYLLHSSLPTSGDDMIPGRLSSKRNIDDLKRQLGTEAEAKVLKPDGKYYTELAQKCINDYATGIEIFLFPTNPRVYLNVATISDLACLTGTGVVNKYHVTSMNNFIEDLKISLKSTMGFDASMRVRTSTGISPVRYIGNFSNPPGANLEMAAVNTTSNFVVQIKYDDKISENELVVVQFAMIYTSVCGERRVRVHNLALTACQTHQDLYNMACCDTLMNVIVRDALDKMRSGALNPKTAKEQIISRITNILTAYRRHCTDPRNSSSQLILPERLKLLAVYLCGALKCDAIDGGPEMFPDDKVIAQINLLGALPSKSQVTFYPRIYAINQYYEEHGYSLIAKLTRCGRLFIDEELEAQCFVLENGQYLFIYFPRTDLGNQFLSSVYGHRKDDPELIWEFRRRDSNETKFLEDLIDGIVAERRRTLTISIIRQGQDRLENVFNTFLYEDKKRQGGPVTARYDNLSYPDMLCFLHSEIKSKLSQ